MCIDFFDKQGFVFVKGTLAFMKDDETVTQYEFNFDEIAVSSSSTKDNVDSLNNEDEPSTGNNQKLTLGKSNALDTALTYLSIGLGFSEKKLKEQLEYEGFLDDEVEYALDNCDANWNEQAVLAANGYLEVMPLSKQRLIEQLEYDGFTREQAEYGASKVGY